MDEISERKKWRGRKESKFIYYFQNDVLARKIINWNEKVILAFRFLLKKSVKKISY